jgi:hypothetical protein
VKRGGVDPNAKGAALEMEEIARRHTPQPSSTGEHATQPNAQATIRSDNRRLPDLPQIIHSPAH